MPALCDFDGYYFEGFPFRVDACACVSCTPAVLQFRQRTKAGSARACCTEIQSVGFEGFDPELECPGGEDCEEFTGAELAAAAESAATWQDWTAWATSFEFDAFGTYLPVEEPFIYAESAGSPGFGGLFAQGELELRVQGAVPLRVWFRKTTTGGIVTSESFDLTTENDFAASVATGAPAHEGSVLYELGCALPLSMLVLPP